MHAFVTDRQTRREGLGVGGLEEEGREQKEKERYRLG